MKLYIVYVKWAGEDPSAVRVSLDEKKMLGEVEEICNRCKSAPAFEGAWIDIRNGFENIDLMQS